jgi:hypothetical protein
MQYINANAYSGTKLKVVSNLYYPGYDADNALAAAPIGDRAEAEQADVFLPYIAPHELARLQLRAQNGFACADSFAQYMGADYDANGDGQIDSDATRYVQGESESAYVTRITSTLRSTIRDANVHFVTPARASTTSSRTTRIRPTPAHDLRRLLRRHGQRLGRRRLQRRTDRRTARTRSGTSSATSAWAGPSPSTTRRRPDVAVPARAARLTPRRLRAAGAPAAPATRPGSRGAGGRARPRGRSGATQFGAAYAPTSVTASASSRQRFAQSTR